MNEDLIIVDRTKIVSITCWWDSLFEHTMHSEFVTYSVM